MADPAEMCTQKISFTNSNYRRSLNRRGFTLIEVMVTLGIMAALIAVGAPRMFKRDGNIKTVARNVIVMVKEVRNHARLFNSTYRLVIRMEDGKHAYWVEKGNGPLMVDPAKLKKDLENPKAKDEEGAPPPLFQLDKSMTKTEKKLPPNLKFAQVETINMSEPITSGLAYIHFFPQGMMEASTIQITDGKNSTWTLVFNPLTGQADVIEKAVGLKSLER